MKGCDLLKKIISILLCVLWMGLIFYNSSSNGNTSENESLSLLKYIENSYHQVDGQSGEKNSRENSNETVKSIGEQILHEISPSAKSKDDKMNVILRKNAHAFEYFALSIFVSISLFSFNIKGKSALIYIMFICLFYAVTDEFHQLFVVGRNSSVIDIFIDFTGSLIGILLFYLFYYKILKFSKKMYELQNVQYVMEENYVLSIEDSLEVFKR